MKIVPDALPLVNIVPKVSTPKMIDKIKGMVSSARQIKVRDIVEATSISKYEQWL